jgi:hypothetical protein
MRGLQYIYIYIYRERERERSILGGGRGFVGELAK